MSFKETSPGLPVPARSVSKEVTAFHKAEAERFRTPADISFRRIVETSIRRTGINGLNPEEGQDIIACSDSRLNLVRLQPLLQLEDTNNVRIHELAGSGILLSVED